MADEEQPSATFKEGLEEKAGELIESYRYIKVNPETGEIEEGEEEKFGPPSDPAAEISAKQRAAQMAAEASAPSPTVATGPVPVAETALPPETPAAETTATTTPAEGGPATDASATPTEAAPAEGESPTAPSSSGSPTEPSPEPTPTDAEPPPNP